FPYHSHWQEEEWIYILEGRGLARIDGAEYEVGPGDFMAFPTPGVAHSLRNPFESELIYLMGGESRELDVADFPDLGRRMFRHAKGVEGFDLNAATPLCFLMVESGQGPFDNAVKRRDFCRLAVAIATLVLHHRQLGAARDAGERRAAHVHLRAVLRLERRVAAFDLAVRDVHDRVLHDDGGAGRDDVAVGDEHFAAAAHCDGVAIDVNVATVELQLASPFTDERIDGAE